MGHSWGTKFVKYMLVGFNLLFVISGIILIIIGASVKTVYRNYDTFLDDKYFSLPNLLIAIGCLIFFISFFGCYGAIRESWLLLYGFIGLLILIFIMEFSGGIAGYVLRDKTTDYLTEKLETDLVKYGSNGLIDKAWDIMQRKFECCGVAGPADWHQAFGNSSLPLSCCGDVYGAIDSKNCVYNDKPKTAALEGLKPDSIEAKPNITDGISNGVSKPGVSADVNSDSKPKAITDGKDGAPESKPKPDDPSNITTTTSSTASTTATQSSSSSVTPQTLPPDTIKVKGQAYKIGCVDGFGKFIQSHAVTLGGVGFAIAVIQLLGILFACHLARQIKYGYYST